MLTEELLRLQTDPRLVAPFTDRYPELSPEAGYAAALKLHEQRLLGLPVQSLQIRFR